MNKSKKYIGIFGGILVGLLLIYLGLSYFGADSFRDDSMPERCQVISGFKCLDNYKITQEEISISLGNMYSKPIVISSLNGTRSNGVGTVICLPENKTLGYSQAAQFSCKVPDDFKSLEVGKKEKIVFQFMYYDARLNLSYAKRGMAEIFSEVK